jgi:hypothetical protein
MLDVTGRRDAVESSVIAPMRGRVAVIEAEADIRRSPEDVFDYASDPAHEPEWNIRMKRLEKLTDGPVSVGAGYGMEFTQVVRRRMQRELERDIAMIKARLERAGGPWIRPEQEGG